MTEEFRSLHNQGWVNNDFQMDCVRPGQGLEISICAPGWLGQRKKKVWSGLACANL